MRKTSGDISQPSLRSIDPSLGATTYGCRQGREPGQACLRRNDNQSHTASRSEGPRCRPSSRVQDSIRASSLARLDSALKVLGIDPALDEPNARVNHVRNGVDDSALPTC